MLYDYLVLAIKADGPRRLPCLPTAVQSLFSLGSPSLFVEGEKEVNNHLWLYFYLIFSLLLILLLIFTSLPFCKKHRSVRKDRKALHFVATTMAFKKIKNPDKTGSSQNVT